MKQHKSSTIPSLSHNTKHLLLRSSPLLLLPFFLSSFVRPIILFATFAALAYILYYTHSPLQTPQHHLVPSKLSVPKQLQAPLNKVSGRKGSGTIDLSKLPNMKSQRERPWLRGLKV